VLARVRESLRIAIRARQSHPAFWELSLT
jgi:hypothetical protein